MNTKTYISQLNLIKLSSGEDVFEKRQMLIRRIFKNQLSYSFLSSIILTQRCIQLWRTHI